MKGDYLYTLLKLGIGLYIGGITMLSIRGIATMPGYEFSKFIGGVLVVSTICTIGWAVCVAILTIIDGKEKEEESDT